jgi:hypothetical protein
MPGDFRLAAVDLEETPGGFRVKRDAEGKPAIGELMEIEEYARAFAGSPPSYHPAEAAAEFFETLPAFDAFRVWDRVTKQDREKLETKLGAVRTWFRENLR